MKLLLLAACLVGLSDAWSIVQPLQQRGVARPVSAVAARTVQPTMSVAVKTIKAGDGKTYPKPGQKVKCHYTGRLMDGTVFDTSKRILGGFGGIGAFEFEIGAGDVIKGWDMGIAKMSVGEKAELTVGPSFGYGNRGAGDAIPPGAVLIFEVELLGVSGKPYFP